MRLLRFPMTLALLALAACAVRPPHEFDSGANFAALQTFQWLEPEYGEGGVAVEHPVLESPLLGRRVERAVTDVLQEKGFRAVEAEPDFFVTYHTAQGERERRSAGYVQLGYGRYDPFFGTGILLDMTPRDFQEGTLIIDIVDAKTDELIWRGWRSAYLSQRNFEQAEVDEAVRYILSAFPPTE